MAQTPYHYIRIETHKDHDTLVVGGGDHPTGYASPEVFGALKPKIVPFVVRKLIHTCLVYILA